MMTVTIPIPNESEAKSRYVQYRQLHREYSGRPDTPFNSPLKESTFLKKMAKGDSVKIGGVIFIGAINISI